MYELMGRTHAWLAQERGQGTVEYVGLIMLLAAIMAVVATTGKDAGIADGDHRQAQGRDREHQRKAGGWGRRAARGPCQTGGVVAPFPTSARVRGALTRT